MPAARPTASPDPITSRRHPLLGRVRAAADGHGDDVLLEGPHLVGEALVARGRVTLVLVAVTAANRPEVASLLAHAAARDVPLHYAGDAAFAAASPARTPAGVLALASLSLSTADQLAGGPDPLVTVAIGVQDPGNLGTLMRSSEAAGVSGVAVLGASAHPFGWKALRGSMGSALRLQIVREADAGAGVRALQQRGLRLVALSAAAAHGLYEVDLTGPLAVCAGAEGTGLSPEVLALCDTQVRIPMCPPVESLNVGVAASLVLFEAMRQRGSRA
ncbi:MAG: TrmH family RNA methyltransferase [Luteitalea sp.]